MWYILKPDKNPWQKYVTIENLQPKIPNINQNTGCNDQQ